MDKNTLTPEELAAEQAAMAEAKEEEVKAKVIEEFNFDPEADADKIAVAVEREMKHRKDLSHAIGQKINYRNELQKKQDPPKKDPPAAVDASMVSAEVTKALENRDLEDLDLPDEIKIEVKKLVALQGVSVKKAVKDPYIVARVEQHKAAQKEDDAALRRKGKGGGGSNKAFDPNNPPDVDTTTPEGQKEWEAWKAEAKKRGL